MIARRPTRKIITRAIAFIIAGAIVNVAVAWGFTLLMHPTYPLQHRQAIDRWAESMLIRNDIRNAGALTGGHSPGAAIITFYTNWRCFQAIAAGWPQFCLEGHITSTSQIGSKIAGINSTDRALVYGSTTFERQDHTAPFVPIGIIWPGFAINTVLYAAILWLLFATPGFVRKRRRIKRGLCPACAYPVGASDVCTECGATVKMHRLRL